MVPTRKSIINNPRNVRAIEVLVNSTTIQWYSKRQDTVESSTHGYEHVARVFLRNNAYLRTVQETPEAPLDEPPDPADRCVNVLSFRLRFFFTNHRKMWNVILRITRDRG